MFDEFCSKNRCAEYRIKVARWPTVRMIRNDLDFLSEYMLRQQDTAVGASHAGYSLDISIFSSALQRKMLILRDFCFCWSTLFCCICLFVRLSFSPRNSRRTSNRLDFVLSAKKFDENDRSSRWKNWANESSRSFFLSLFYNWEHLCEKSLLGSNRKQIDSEICRSSISFCFNRKTTKKLFPSKEIFISTFSFSSSDFVDDKQKENVSKCLIMSNRREIWTRIFVHRLVFIVTHLIGWNETIFNVFSFLIRRKEFSLCFVENPSPLV